MRVCRPSMLLVALRALWPGATGLRVMPGPSGSGLSQPRPCELDVRTRVPVCTLDPWVRPHDYAEQRVRSFEPYVATNRMPPAGTSFDPKTTAVVFVHVSKSGGVTFRSLLEQVARRRGWGEVQVLRRRTWARVVRECLELASRAASPLCNQVFYSSTDALGLCEFLNRPYCVYVTVLREPMSRLLSSYNYFCTLGSEGRKGWQSNWTSCGWNEAQWASVMTDFLTLQLGTSHAPQHRISALESMAQCADCPMLATAPKGASRRELLTAAKANFASGAVLPLFLDTLTRDVQELAGRLGLPELAEEASRSKAENVHSHREVGIESSLGSSEALAADLELYHYVQDMSE
mmetsp:Transcript_14798/g.40900  ORF Transcript_14798/g.40900 Transcript_14798/m.40900 type:complete len:348 (-) Transcript_14798:12-1055(-)